MTARERIAGNVANYVDERTGAAAWMKKNLKNLKKLNNQSKNFGPVVGPK